MWSITLPIFLKSNVRPVKSTRILSQLFRIIVRITLSTHQNSNTMIIFKPYYLLLSFCLALLFSCSPKQASVLSPDLQKKQEELIAPVKEKIKIPVDERLTMGKLNNGIRYYIQKNQRPENRAELRLAVNAGSILEDNDQLGLAHFVEHMAFNGTEHFEKSELVDYLESVGTRFGPDLNAYTSFDETVYMLQVRTDSTELFDKGMLILRDWANGVTFDNEEIDKERGVVESEWRSRLSPDQRMQQKYFPVLYHGSQYAERLPIGDPEIIQNADYETVKRYYRDWYRPDLMAVVVVGDIDVEEVESDIGSLFGDMLPVENPRSRQKYSVPHHDETLISIVSDKEASFTNVRLVYKHDRVKTVNLDDYRASMIRSLYNSMLGARLQEITKQPDPPFMFAFSGYRPDVGDIDSYSAMAFAPEGKASTALTSLLTENKRVLLHGFTLGEMERAKKKMIEDAERGFKEMDKTESNQLAMSYVYKYLKDNPTPSPKQVLDLYQKNLPSIRLIEVNALAAKWVRDKSRVVVMTGPKKEETPLPTEADVRAMLDEMAAKEVEAYADEVVDAPLFDKILESVAEDKNKTFDGVDIEYLELANGVEVYLKKTDFKNDEVLMSAFSPGGSSLYEDDEYFNATNAASIVREGGVGAFSPVQLEKLLAGKTVGVSPYIGTYSEGFNGSASPDDLEILFQLVYKYFTEPRIDDEAFQSFVTRQKGLYKNLMSDPRYFFSDYVSKKKYDNHARVGWPDEEDWAELDYGRAMVIYDDRFADASDFTFSFVGNFNEESIRGYIQKYLGNLPVVERNEDWKDVGIRAVKGGMKDRIKRGEAQKTNVHMYFHGDFEYSRQNNYLMNSMLAYLRIKMREELREDLGGVYGVGVFGGGSKKPKEQYGITISFNADPPMTDTLVQAAKDVIKKAMTDGPNEEDMTKVKEIQKQGRIKNLKENWFWQRLISREYEDGLSFENVLIDDFEVQIENLTSEQIKHAVVQYFSYENYIEIIMDPEGEGG